MSIRTREFAEFGSLRDRLTAVLCGLCEIYEAINYKKRSLGLLKARQRLTEECFHIVTVGEVKRGKSTLVNALLGEELLPMKWHSACTAIPISVCHGEQRRALCRKRNGDVIEYALPSDLLAFLEAIKIPEKTARVGPDDDLWALMAHPFERAEVFVPIALLKNGVKLQDTAGLNEDLRRSRDTWDQCDLADAVILVLDCNKETQSDKEDLGRLLSRGRDSRTVFVVWNNADKNRRQDAASFEQMKHEALMVSAAQGIPNSHVFFISALEALTGRSHNQLSMVEESGLPDLERALSSFLVNERASTKLINSLEVAEHALVEAVPAVQAWGKDLRSRAASAQGDSVRAQKSQTQAKKTADAQLERMNRRISECRQELSTAVKSLAEQLRTGFSKTIEDAVVSKRDAIFDGKATEARLVGIVREWATAVVANWEKDAFAAILERHGSELRAEAVEAKGELEAVAVEVADLETRMIVLGRSAARVPGDDVLHFDQSFPDIRQVIPSTNASEGLVVGGVVPGMALGAGSGALVAVVYSIPVVGAVAVAGSVVGGAIGLFTSATRLKSRVTDALRSGMTESADRLEKAILAKLEDACERVRAAITIALTEVTSSIQASVSRIESHCRIELKITGEQQAQCETLLERLQEYRVELAEVRREIDPLHKLPRAMEEMEQAMERQLLALNDAVRRIRKVDGAVELPPHERLLARLQDEGRGRFEMLRKHYASCNRWDAEIAQRIAGAWLAFQNASEMRDARSQTPVYRTVSAVAVLEGQPTLPTPTEARGQRNNPSWWREVLMVLELMIDQETASKLMKDQERFLMYYGRAYQQLRPGLKTREGAAEEADLSWESLIPTLEA